MRNYILKLLLTDDEKYLMIRAVDERLDRLNKSTVTDKYIVKDNVKSDCKDYIKMRSIFTTELCR